MPWTIKVLGKVTGDEATAIKEAQAELDAANVLQQRANLATSEGNVLLQAVNIKLARKYKLQPGDFIDPVSCEIRRNVQEETEPAAEPDEP